MNKIIITGRLTNDPEICLSIGANAITFARFSIAVTRKFKRDGQPEADYFNCTAFGKQAEFIEKYVRKGTKLIIGGNLQNNNYTNRYGEKVNAVQINIEELEFAERKKTNDAGYIDNNNPATPSGGVNLDELNLQEDLPF